MKNIPHIIYIIILIVEWNLKINELKHDEDQFKDNVVDLLSLPFKLPIS